MRFGKIMLAALFVAAASQSHAQLATYTTLAGFQAASGSTSLTTFNGTATQFLGTPSSSTVAANFGNFSVSGDANGDYVAIAAGSSFGNIDGSDFFYFSQRNPTTGIYDGDGGAGPSFNINFSSPQTAFGFDYVDLDPTDSYQITINGTTFADPPFNTNGAGSGFFGVVAMGGQTFTSVAFTQNASGGIVDPFGIDNIRVSSAAAAAPTPEPGSVAFLVGMGLSGAAFLRRRKNTHKPA